MNEHSELPKGSYHLFVNWRSDGHFPSDVTSLMTLTNCMLVTPIDATSISNSGFYHILVTS